MLLMEKVSSVQMVKTPIMLMILIEDVTSYSKLIILPIEIQKITERIHRYDKHSVSEDKNYRQLIAALSKIAKVHLSEDPSAIVEVDPMLNNQFTARGKSPYQENDASEDAAKSILFTTKSISNLSHDVIFHKVSNNRLKQERFQCQAIRDIHIPSLQEDIPSYKCEYGSKTFILSSKRFFDDRRNTFYVHVDNNILRKLYEPTETKNNRYNVIQAALKPKREDYNIR